MVLVEEGPWNGSITNQLKRLQQRLYGCIDAALDGQLAQRFPESSGKNIVIELDCYDLPRSEVTNFFAKFSEGVFRESDYGQALRESRFVKTCHSK